jgi:hypothetical protein
MKAVDALTINEEYRLKKKIIEYEDKLKDAPKIGELESHLAAKIIEQDALKKQVERLQLEKQNETQTMQHKYEQDLICFNSDIGRVIPSFSVLSYLVVLNILIQYI